MRFVRVFWAAVASLAAMLALGAPAGAAPPLDPALAAIPGTMARAVVADNVAALRATCAPSAAVVDEFAPYSWSGPDACVRWAAAFKASVAQRLLSHVRVNAAPQPFYSLRGDTAYLTARVTFFALVATSPINEEGTWTFVLVKSGGAWQITSLTWGALHH